MTTKISRTPEEVTLEMQIRMEGLLKEFEKVNEVLDGTLRTRGLRDRLLLAEEDIKSNKAAWEKVDRKLDEQTKTLSDKISTSQGFINKWQPYLNAATWLITGAATILLSMLLSGKLAF